MTREDHPPGNEHARDFYNTWPFVQQAVCLYVHGMAWKGGWLQAFLDAERSEQLVEVSQDNLLSVVSDWIIDGATMVAVREGNPPSIAPPADGEAAFAIRTPSMSPMEPPARSLLWPACHNHPAMKNMADQARNVNALQLLGFLQDSARKSLYLPTWAFNPVEASQADMDAVHYNLHMYRLMVDQRRKAFLSCLRHAIQPWLSERFPDAHHWFESWNAEWMPDDGLAGWEGVYWAFDQCGLTLRKYGQDYPAWLRQETYFVRPSVLDGWRALGL